MQWRLRLAFGGTPSLKRPQRMPPQGPLALDTPTWNRAYPKPNTLKSPNLLLYSPYLGTVQAVCQAGGLGSPRHLPPGSFEDGTGSAAPPCSGALESAHLAPSAPAPRRGFSLVHTPRAAPTPQAPPWGPSQAAVRTAMFLKRARRMPPPCSKPVRAGRPAPQQPSRACCRDAPSLLGFSCLRCVPSTGNHDASPRRKTSGWSKRRPPSRPRAQRFARLAFTAAPPGGERRWRPGAQGEPEAERGQPTGPRAHSGAGPRPPAPTSRNTLTPRGQHRKVH